jgi:alcohol dehydrogenase class IV
MVKGSDLLVAALTDRGVRAAGLTRNAEASLAAAKIEVSIFDEVVADPFSRHPISDQLARQALSLLSANIRRVFENGGDLEARSQMLLGSMLAGLAFANAPVAAVHALAYPIGAIFHVPHRLSNALVLTQVLRFNLPETESLCAELAPIVDPRTDRRMADGQGLKVGR